VSEYARGWRVSAGAPVAPLAWNPMPMNSLRWQRPPRAFLDTRQQPRVSGTISDVAGGVGDGLRAYPRRRATGLLLESPWIPRDGERGGRISTVGGYAPPGGLLVVSQTHRPAERRTRVAGRKPIRYTRFHDDGSIRTAVRTLERKFGLPDGSVRLVYPSGRRARWTPQSAI
jgi:hypothetical protein